jgi:hypothetical protein
MNGKVARMLRKTGRDTHRAKKWWYSLESSERGELRTDWNKMKEIYDRHVNAQ